jgi:hypothetical protein
LPFFYDLNRATSTNASAGTVSTHFWGKTVANQETVGIYGLYAASRWTIAGGAQLRLAHNTGVTASGGTSQTAQPKNLRGNPAGQSSWFSDAAAITAGTTLLQRLTIGFAQTGGMGGYVPIVPTAAVQMMPNATNPVDVEIQSVVATGGATSVTFDLTIDVGEGI